ncbi:hypothetical protein IAG41_15975 [Sphingomonas sp. JC676]|uniref:hypothetical protein n=1 Tax=Sphingomonas sp. JC676 TaxID=2768065 RepID=UPI0016583BC8|nr:hypothetical protein [Sphingomonas sp. JC676]MBC9033891.1 hypothetical protein [Sphingomonas sp. JC676]
MLFLLLFAIGAVLGAVAAAIGQVDRRPVFFGYVKIAILGALFGGYVLADAIGHEPAHPGDLDLVVLLAAIFGAIAVLVLLWAVANSLRRGTPR